MLDAVLDAIVSADEPGVVAALSGRSEAERATAAAVLVPEAGYRDSFGHFVRAADGGLEWQQRTGYADLAEDHPEMAQPAAFELAVLGTATARLGPGGRLVP